MERKSRNTKQKELLNEEVKKFNSFFTAEELLIRSKKKDSHLGIATIYRFLSDLTDKSKLHSYICNRKTIYSSQDNSHCHFTCKKCGKIEHIKVNSLDFIKNKINGQICHFQIDVTGLCKECSKN